MDQHFTYSNNWLGLSSIYSLWTRNAIFLKYSHCSVLLPQLPLFPVVDPIIRPSGGYHIIVLVLLFFLNLAPSFTCDASQAVVFQDDRLNFKDLKMLKKNLPYGCFLNLVSSLAPLAWSWYHTSNHERLDSSSHSCNQRSGCLYAGKNNFGYF